MSKIVSGKCLVTPNHIYLGRTTTGEYYTPTTHLSLPGVHPVKERDLDTGTSVTLRPLFHIYRPRVVSVVITTVCVTLARR